MESDDPKISKVTKVLIHKIHGGRKKDSKFWNDQIDLTKTKDEALDIAIPKDSSRFRKTLQYSVFPFSTLLIVIVVLIFARPDLFTFLDYHKIASVFFGSPEIIEKHSIEETRHQYNRTYPYQSRANSSSRRNDIYHKPQQLIPTSNKTTNPSSDLCQVNQCTNTTGKVFSWKDSDGKLYFSNTNFPVDNDTLQVQTEINTYKKVTKIHISGNQIYVPVTLRNNGRSITVHMLLDTGCSTTTIPYAYLNKLSARYGKDVTSIVADGRRTYGKKAFLDMIQIGSQRERNFTVHGAKVAGSNNSGLLGLDFLKNRAFKIDVNSNFLIWM